MKKILFVSYGSITKKHIQNLKLIKKKFVIGILRKKNKETEIGKYTVFNKISDAISFNPDAVFICSPANQHIYYLKSFMGVCDNIFVEKPLFINTNQLRNIKFQKIKNFQLGYFLRYHPHLQKLKKIIKNNYYGKIKSVQIEVGQYLPDWRKEVPYHKTVSAQKKLGGGVMLELSHEIDYAVWLFGIPKFLFCQNKKLSNLKIDVEDYSTIYFDYPKEKKIVQINLNMLQKNMSRSCTIIFEKKTLKIDFIRGTFFELIGKNYKVIDFLGKNFLKQLLLIQDSHFLSKLDISININKKNKINDFANFKTGEILSKILAKLELSNKKKKVVHY